MRRAQYIVASERMAAERAVTHAEELIERLKRKERDMNRDKAAARAVRK